VNALLDWVVQAAAALWLALAGAPATPYWQGYAEGDFVRIGLPAGGRVAALAVKRGDRVAAGQFLFALDDTAERAAADEARARLSQAEAQVANLLKGRRAPELAAIAAQKAQAEAALALSRLQFERQAELYEARVVAKSRYDEARATYDRDAARVDEMKRQLEVAQMAARSDEIRAAERAVDAARADLKQAEWRLAERRAHAPTAARVTDTIFEPGEYAGAGVPVVELLPPANIKIRFFVPEPMLPKVALGQAVALSCDGCASGLTATVTYLAPKAEFTPPIVFSETSRKKFVFLAEAVPAAPEAFRPGQPVDVRLAP
jgi:HlyD family secretion protein